MLYERTIRSGYTSVLECCLFTFLRSDNGHSLNNLSNLSPQSDLNVEHFVSRHFPIVVFCDCAVKAIGYSHVHSLWIFSCFAHALSILLYWTCHKLIGHFYPEPFLVTFILPSCKLMLNDPLQTDLFGLVDFVTIPTCMCAHAKIHSFSFRSSVSSGIYILHHLHINWCDVYIFILCHHVFIYFIRFLSLSIFHFLAVIHRKSLAASIEFEYHHVAFICHLSNYFPLAF